MCTDNKPVPHVHAELIKAWADGAEIQSRVAAHFEWADTKEPSWGRFIQYRIKPAPKVKKYLVAYREEENISARISGHYHSSVEEFKSKHSNIRFKWTELIQASVIEV